MIPVNTPLLDGNEQEYVLKALKDGWISSEGPAVKEFEEKFAARVGRKHGIAVANGSVALDLAVVAAGIKEGDEVIMPSFTIISPATAVVRVGAKPILVDSDATTWNMDVTQIESKITAKTKAILVVHIYGLPVDMEPVMALAKKYNLLVIEDAAEMHGQTYNGQPCGSFGDISTFSFYPNKHVTTGEGGMVVCNNDELAGRCKHLRNLAFIPERRFVHHELGWNYRFTNLQAAIGLAQLERLDYFIEKKRAMGKLYRELFTGLEDKIELQAVSTSYAENIYWVFGMVLKENVPFNAIEAMKRLAAEGIGCRPFFYPMHQQPVFNKMGWYNNEKHPVAERMAERGFYVPSGLALTETEMRIVSDKLNKVLNG
ncbi:MAG TPA: DegT/DnrJ/EryC1/StrS family aminotransferase [Chitinophagales bacterium]|nr:DegT/DnrJ/EryC1/StrS family aminotransferase [Chitinophagales bacterium]